VQKILTTGLVFSLFLSASALGQSRLKKASSAQVNAGFIAETVVIADSANKLFLEFIKGDRVAKSLDGQIYDGEILPPVQIDNQYNAPRARMRELLSFEVISDTNESLELIDQFAAMTAKQRLRTSLGNQAGNRSQGAQIITLFDEGSNISDPALWKYNPENVRSPWKRLGGIMAETPIESEKLFSAFLFSTGTYTIWDENPLPTFEPSFQNDEIELAEASPFPSVIEEEEELATFENEDFVKLLEGEEAFFDADFTDSPSIGDDEPQGLVPAVGLPDNSTDSTLVPAVAETQTVTPSTSQAPVNSTPSTGSNFLLAPPTNSNTQVPATPPPNQPPENEAGLGQALQANSFQDFGTSENGLPVAGGFQFPWFLLMVFGIIGFSVYAIRQKPY
jgi:hypothetical protein